MTVEVSCQSLLKNRENVRGNENVGDSIMKAIANACGPIFIAQSLAQFFNSRWHDCLTVIGRIIQQSLARFFNSHCHD